MIFWISKQKRRKQASRDFLICEKDALLYRSSEHKDLARRTKKESGWLAEKETQRVVGASGWL
jgi:hypothetical protein